MLSDVMGLKLFLWCSRLLDLGFGKDIKSILSILDSQPVGNPKTHARNKGRHRQHLLLSATLGDGVMELASLSLRNPVTVGLTELPKKSANLSSESGTLSLDSNGGNRDNDVQAPLEYNVPVQLVQRYMTGKVSVNKCLNISLGVRISVCLFFKCQ